MTLLHWRLQYHQEEPCTCIMTPKSWVHESWHYCVKDCIVNRKSLVVYMHHDTTASKNRMPWHYSGKENVALIWIISTHALASGCTHSWWCLQQSRWGKRQIPQFCHWPKWVEGVSETVEMALWYKWGEGVFETTEISLWTQMKQRCIWNIRNTSQRKERPIWNVKNSHFEHLSLERNCEEPKQKTESCWWKKFHFNRLKNNQIPQYTHWPK